MCIIIAALLTVSLGRLNVSVAKDNTDSGLVVSGETVELVPETFNVVLRI